MTDIAGEIGSKEAWAILEKNPKAQLVDVRTEPEWRYSGFPDLGSLGRRAVALSWQAYPTMQINPNFLAELQRAGLNRDAPLLFICRSGARSLAAARIAAEAGFTRCYNVKDGFEGPRDGNGRRASISGWKQANLPWVQE